ncbi:MAG: hypothetical protein JWM11_3112 [Planctomycetaceae bacterium]|nr:hypothetical protein [Planctomycetaceae bacterium]
MSLRGRREETKSVNALDASGGYSVATTANVYWGSMWDLCESPWRAVGVNPVVPACRMVCVAQVTWLKGRTEWGICGWEKTETKCRHKG